MFRKLLPGLFIICCACSVSASNLSFSNTGSFNVNLSMEGFSLTAHGLSPITGVPSSFDGPPGSVLNLSGEPFLLPSDFDMGSVLVNGVSYPVWYGYFPPAGYVSVTLDISLSAGSVTLPQSGDSDVTLTAPLTISRGSVRGTGYNGTPVFSVGFNGSGLASVTFRPDQYGGYYVSSIGYSFDLAPIPEPSSLFLFSSGFGALIRCFRHKFRSI